MRLNSGALFLALGVGAAAFAASEPPAAAHDRGDDVSMTQFSIPVTLSDGNTYDVAAYLFVAAHGHRRHRTVQLLVHGATYNHEYWDAPDLDGRDYSYAREMARRGYVVLSIDQLGAGDSDKPDGDFFSLDEAASTLHQIAPVARALGHGHSPKLAFVGHSNGSVTSIYAQGTHGDADLLVTTGWHHVFRELPVDPTDPDIQAAVATPYIHFAGPKRDVLMYFLPSTDPAMVPFDDAHLTDSMPRHQFLDLIGVHADITARGPGGMTTLTRSQAVTSPVLVQVGDHDDRIAPAAAALAPPGEQAFYPQSPDFTLQVLSDIGHCVNLHTNHLQSWDGIDDWISAHEDDDDRDPHGHGDHDHEP